MNYNNLFKINQGPAYGNNNLKLIICFTGRAGCSVTFKNFLRISSTENNNFMKELEKYSWVHEYRLDYLHNRINTKTFEQCIVDNYTIVKTVLNPYQRAVSIFKMNPVPNHLTFKEFLIKLLQNYNFGISVKNHAICQYDNYVDRFVTKVIHLDRNEKIKIKDKIFDPNIEKSHHHTVRKEINSNQCLGLIIKKDIKEYPKKYKQFYNDEIKQLVDKIYEIDIKMYNYSFEEDF